MSQPSDESPAEYQPYVPADATLPEFTWSAVLVGAILGIIFGASSLYLVMKVGMTVSASIPVAVLAITLFRAFSHAFGFRRATILENNIVQTTGSAGESIAFGVGVTMPAVMILGFEMEWTRVMVVSVLGGLLGILMMVPLRKAFCVQQHGILKFPEGTACADVLKIGETGGATAKTVFAGFGIAFVYQLLMSGIRLWRDTVSYPLDWLKGATASMEANPALLGVGYIIGVRVSCIMVAGGILAWFVLVPMVAHFGAGANTALLPATGSALIRNMSSADLHSKYVMYIGAGAVAAGGIISMCRTLPLIISSIFAGLRDVRAAAGTAVTKRRTERDLSMRTVLIGSLVMIAGIWAFLIFDPQGGGGGSWSSLGVSFIAALLIVLLGFLFVVVSARLTGEIGSSSNPISGMTVATLLLTCMLFFLAGLRSHTDQLIALSVAAVVCIACSNGGTNAQALKTGFLVGATPKYQQYAILIGSLTSALVIGVTLLVLNQAGTVYSKKPENVPVLTHPLDVSKLTLREKGPDGKEYYVWHAVEGQPDTPEAVPTGKFLVNDRGQPVYLKDRGINGRLKYSDDGKELTGRLSAPQAEIFALITRGILNQKLPWTLVLLGVLLAVVLELCGVAALPFAVGVYLPLSSTTPIFLGGLVRYAIERTKRKQDGAPASELESEMSPGALFSTGYIAGGTMGGVLIAFLALIPGFSDWLARGEKLPHRSITAIVTYFAIALLLFLVGRGWLLKSKEETA
ncbi:MAG: oligopeptide transporter, OPT family [Thermoguttaceae bacterium]